MSNLQTYYHFKLDFQKSGPIFRGQVVNVTLSLIVWAQT